MGVFLLLPMHIHSYRSYTLRNRKLLLFHCFISVLLSQKLLLFQALKAIVRRKVRLHGIFFRSEKKRYLCTYNVIVGEKEGEREREQ